MDLSVSGKPPSEGLSAAQSKDLSLKSARQTGRPKAPEEATVTLTACGQVRGSRLTPAWTWPYDGPAEGQSSLALWQLQGSCLRGVEQGPWNWVVLRQRHSLFTTFIHLKNIAESDMVRGTTSDHRDAKVSNTEPVSYHPEEDISTEGEMAQWGLSWKYI